MNISLSTFIHANHSEMDDFQREVFRRVFTEDFSPKTIPTLNDCYAFIYQNVHDLKAVDWVPEKMGTEQVQKPDHYDRFPIEPTYILTVNKGLPWTLANFIKYIMRYPYKNGIQDLEKAARNLEMHIKFCEGNPEWSR